ncbi:AraC-like DNA-binding protein [Tamaricihabitans halophyticus]|uniref:AraC-like DNA-binding protein n=1 Tax=Tamaricihabitans halophyticus TaxID=1262583 RepID=A0A4R2R435_9PSEU|nr:AraC family transcriptional regulator [Tamaricihabitans halophyticus]TCP54145.1 AraC-like DNA-binding protein [Tamaricihabitans halophyticus]
MSSETYLVDRAATDEVAPRDRPEFWSESTAAYQCRASHRYIRPHEFTARATRQRTTSYQLVEWEVDQPEWVYRTRLQVRQDCDENYRLMLPVSGTMQIFGQRGELATPVGHGAVFTVDTPFRMMLGPANRGVILTFSRQELERKLNRSAPPIALLNLRLGLGGVLADMLTRLATEREHLGSWQFDAVCERIVEILSLLVLGDDRPSVTSYSVEIEHAVRRYVREHAGDRLLTGSKIAMALGWSLRHVQRSLQEVGTTPQEVIRQERLGLAMRMVQAPKDRCMTLTEIANRCGFTSLSTFSTQFRQQYGAAPREFR